MMQYRTVPKTGEKLSALGFGGMRFPLQKNGRIDAELASAQLRYAIDQGVNYIDTAYLYHSGESETFIGKALAGGYRERVNIATKLPWWFVKTRADMDRYLNIQLSRLQTDHIDYYLIHGLKDAGWETMRDLGVREFLVAARDEGKIRNLGFSFHDSFPVFRKIVDSFDWDFCQIQFNYLDEHYQAGLEGLRYAAGKDLAVMVMEPLRGGVLGGPPPKKIAVILEKAPVKRSPAEWALRWVWNHPGVIVVLSGMNDMAHVGENIRIASDALPGALTAEELDVLKDVQDTYRSILKVGCTGCGYCMPCPSGVNIPECFALYNTSFLSSQKGPVHFTTPKFMYLLNLGGVAGKAECASLCRKCGKCMKACPQNLPIPELLEDVRNRMEGKTMWIKRPLFRVALRAMRFRERIAGADAK